MIKELDIVALTRDVPEFGLVTGDIGTVVFDYSERKGSPAFEVEFTSLNGKAIAVVTLGINDARPVRDKEIAHVRQVA